MPCANGRKHLIRSDRPAGISLPFVVRGDRFFAQLLLGSFVLTLLHRLLAPVRTSSLARPDLAVCAYDANRFRPAPAAPRIPACAASAAPAQTRSYSRSSTGGSIRNRQSSRR